MAKITEEKLNGTGAIVRGDAEHLPFRRGVFDSIVCVRSFHFFPNPLTFLSEAIAALKDGGVVIVSYEKKIPGRHLLEKLRIVPTPLVKRNHYTNSKAARMIERKGLKVLRTHNVTKLPLLAYWGMRDDRLLRLVHSSLPSWFGTVGMVVSRKGSNG